MIVRTKRALIVIASALCSLGCVYFPTEYTVTPSFVVHVTNRNEPVVGLKLRAMRPKEEPPGILFPPSLQRSLPDPNLERVVEAITDTNGDAHFHLDRLGAWDLRPDNPAGGWGVVVYADPNFQTSTVHLAWPASQVLETKLLQGRIGKGLMFRQSTPLKGTRLSLHDFVSLTQLAMTKTADDGSFHFGDVPPGMYFLGLNANANDSYGSYGYQSRPHGYIPVRIAEDSPRQELSILADESDCGLDYDLEENKAKWQPYDCSYGDGRSAPCP